MVVCHEPEAGLRAIIAVHDTTLGPALGGIRMWHYDSERGRAHRRAAAEPGDDLQERRGRARPWRREDGRARRSAHPKTELMFRALGRFVDSLGGRYLAAEDVGTSTADAEVVARETGHITGLPVERGGSGDPSPMTAWGVFCGIRAALAEAGLGDALDGIRVAVQGAGHVGAGLVRHLLDAGGRT